MSKASDDGHRAGTSPAGDSDTSNSPARKSTGNAKDKEKHFRFLELLPELRCLVYEKCIESHGGTSLRSSQKLQSLAKPLKYNPSAALYSTRIALILANKQVHREFADFLCSSPKILISINVSDKLEFRHAVKMANSWAAEPGRKLIKPPGKLVIIFSLDKWDTLGENILSNAADGLKLWPSRMVEVLPCSNAPEVAYTADGSSDEIYSCVEFLESIELTGEDPLVVEQHEDIIEALHDAAEEAREEEEEEFESMRHRNSHYSHVFADDETDW